MNVPAPQVVANNNDITTTTEEAYDIFYTPLPNNGSPYDKLYSRPLSKHHSTIIQQILNSADKAIKENPHNPRTIRVVDFGCGSGRYRASIQEAAKFIKEQGYNVPIELVACDISSTGLDEFRKKLTKEGYNGNNQMMKKDNVTFRFVKTTEEMPLYEVAARIGIVDNAISPFGPVGYIKTRNDRRQMIKMLNDITTNQLFFTLPGQNHMRAEQVEAAERRKNGMATIAKNDGDIMYLRAGGQVKLFFHIYQGMKEVQEDLDAAGIKGRISISNIEHEDSLTHGREQEVLDHLASSYLDRVAPQFIRDAVSKYYMVTASKNKQVSRVPERDSLEYKYDKSLRQNQLLNI